MEKDKKNKHKVCPILAIGSGYIDSFNQNRSPITKLPRCLREDCELWSDHYVRDSLKIKTEGKCGLKGTNE